MKYNILIKFPTRGRPEKFKATLEKHINLASKKHNIRYIFTFDDDDETMNTDEMKTYLNNLPVSNKFYFGNSEDKIEAINANMDDEDFDILILASDDMIPLLKDYDDIIAEKFTHSQFGLDCTLHFTSARWSDHLNIQPILGKLYYDRFGYIYHPAYKSISCDNEYTDVSRILRRDIFVPLELFSHNYLSQCNGDETCIKNHEFNHHDGAVFQDRKAVDYDLNIPIPNDFIYCYPGPSKPSFIAE